MSRTVFDNAMVAHVWAARSQTEGRSNNGQFYFNGPRLYSYGSHYLMGLRLGDGGANDATLINSTSYSITTSKHSGYAHRAARGAVYSVPHLTELDNAGAFKPGYNAREVLRHWLFKHHKGLADATAELLLLYAGHKDPAAKWATIKESAERRDAAQAAKDKRAENKIRIGTGETALRLSLAEWPAHIRASGQYALENDAVNLFHAHRAMKAANRTKQAAEVWKRLKIMRKEIAKRKAFASAANVIRVRRQRIEFYRLNVQYFYNCMFGFGDPWSASDLDGIGNRCGHIAEMIREPGRAKLITIIDALAEAVTAKRAAEQAEREEALKHAVSEWLAGETGERYSLYGLGRTLIRARNVQRDDNGTITGGILETSQGAEVPLVHAIRAFRFLKLCRLTGRTWKRNGHAIRVGHFALDSVQSDGSFVAGCHTIGWAEVERLATQLGVFELPASDLAVESRQNA